MIGRQYAMISGKVNARLGNECGKPGHKVDGLEGNPGSSVSLGCFQGIDDFALRAERLSWKSLPHERSECFGYGHSGPGDVTAEPLMFFPLACLATDAGVQRKDGGFSDALKRLCRFFNGPQSADHESLDARSADKES